MRPALWHNGDKLYAIGGFCVEVPVGTTMGTRDANNDPIEVKDRWTVEGSNGNRYTVTKVGDAFKCSCPGYGFRRKCKHSKKISEEVN